MKTTNLSVVNIMHFRPQTSKRFLGHIALFLSVCLSVTFSCVYDIIRTVSPMKWRSSMQYSDHILKCGLIWLRQISPVTSFVFSFCENWTYSEIPLLRPPQIKTFYLLKPYFEIISYSFLHFLHPVYLWLETTFGTVQKWSLRSLLDSPKGGLNIGILRYLSFF